MICSYLENLFCCDYLIYINTFIGMMTFVKTGQIKLNFKHLIFKSSKKLNQWKESNLLKVNNKNFMEFQIHNNRNCIKCRFDMRTIMYLIKYDLLCGVKISNKVTFSFNILKDYTKSIIEEDFYFIKKCIEDSTNKPFKDIHSVLDLYSDSGEFSKFLLNNGILDVTSNDYRPHAFVLSNCLTSKNIDIFKCEKIIETLNDLDWKQYETSDLLIYKHYIKLGMK